MKDLVAYINEMSLEQLGNYITKTLRISYDDAKEILSDKDVYNKKLYTDNQTTFKETITNFIKIKFGLLLNKDDFKSNRKKLSKTNQEKIIKSNRIIKQFLSIFGDLNDENKQIFLDIISKNLLEASNSKVGFLTISDIFPEESNIFYSEQKNIFKVITDNLNINNIDDNFTYILKELSELTLSGGQAQGKFENLLNTFIKGTIIEKAPGDVNISITDNKNLHLEVKFCRKCNFGPYKNKGNITEDNIEELFNKFNNKNNTIKEKKTCIHEYISDILNKYGTPHCNIKDLSNFLDNYSDLENIKVKEDMEKCIAIYFIHWYLTNQFKINNNNDNYYLILFKDTRSISDENYGNYIWINAKKYQNTNDNIKELINFFDKNLYISDINRGNIEISFKK